MNKAFTLIELLVVVAIMGLLGTASVGGYRQMQRGMEERRVVDNASRFLELAYERAQIDRQPTVVYYWNEMIRAAENEDESAVIVGRAVAVRMRGRITKHTNDFLIDEFGDLERFDASGNYLETEVNDRSVQASRLYLLDNINQRQYSLVTAPELARPVNEMFASYDPRAYGTAGLNDDEGGNGRLLLFGYRVEDLNGANWHVGSKYGMEFQSIELPRGYLFGSQVPAGISDPVTTAQVLSFSPTGATGGSLQIYAIRQLGSGDIAPVPIGSAQVSSQMN